MTLPRFVEELISKIEYSGFEAFVVGGCVRDALLGREPKDWDITTSATPDDIVKIFNGFRILTIGFKHGTVAIVTKNGIVEITTYRIDGEYTDSRHPDNVMFAAKISDDLARRDFTINAMAFNPRHGLVDLFEGQNDLRCGIVRCVGEPSRRFGEDSLRIMRALRFAAVLGFEIENQTSAAIFSCKGFLHNIARERIAAELTKLILANNPCRIFTEYSAVFAEVLGVDNLEVWSANSQALHLSEPSLSIRFALLFDGLDSEKILKRLKFDNKTICEVKLLSHYLNKDFYADEIFIKRLLAKIGTDSFGLILKAKQVKFPQQSSEIDQIKNIFEKIISENLCYSITQLDIDGNDLKRNFGLKGKEIGIALCHLLDAVICGKCRNTKSDLLEYMQKSNGM